MMDVPHGIQSAHAEVRQQPQIPGLGHFIPRPTVDRLGALLVVIIVNKRQHTVLNEVVTGRKRPIGCTRLESESYPTATVGMEVILMKADVATQHVSETPAQSSLHRHQPAIRRERRTGFVGTIARAGHSTAIPLQPVDVDRTTVTMIAVGCAATVPRALSSTMADSLQHAVTRSALARKVVDRIRELVKRRFHRPATIQVPVGCGKDSDSTWCSYLRD